MNKFARITAATAFAVLSAGPALAVDEHYIAGDAVVGGYDVVAYHTVGAPTMGSADYSATYQGATWYFSSAENLEMFNADPAKFAPAYGGWCSAGASKGKKVPTQPDLFAIVDGQLYLNSSPGAHNNLFLADTETVIRKGEGNWKQIFATPASDL
ncbi:YHS domain-containing (seleno)protein [uncultured Aliiroseovarius sp.]|uniref:YHS domain-containing (seleno)protein n=1 Tax=uncultured Aliiroseovarius sp. TaxID=1658783 RepID=UPI002612BD06|nr:YHS domain-containing (seleno)protein [uncultured Aliiroseovarius sp.]